ncbi:efflux RND transporter periplasmic adaptor subunit [Helicobacter sp. 11S02629-2]|uniref:efflux RND transporter periplasmic adaptor subunit n=1 Tax=Helicobacter sp. 11S02629-2 TaxID=1476195 RepID=UPI000BA65B5C|nr:efflux RND transporter periplasmic adaptor subunit [Helicobacter sp. 11S02629-2]PAF45380.1 hypothetical protein BKH40_04115 [Helicobacter sp. 11S02629-2]
MQANTIFKLLTFGILLFGVAFSRPVLVKTTPIKEGSLEKQSVFIGTINYKESSQVASQRQGVVQDLRFSVGERVKKGQVLVSLNTDVLQKELEVKEAKIEEAKFQAQKIINEVARYKNLLDEDAIALQQYENLEFELKAKMASITSLQADYDLSKEELTQMDIKAPFDGIVINRLTNVGQWLKVGDPVALILNTSHIEVIVYVPSNIAKFQRIGSKVNMDIDNKHYLGRITALIPRADELSRTFPIHISLPYRPNFLDGMAVEVRLNTEGLVSGYLVPRDSVVEYQGRTVIFIVQNGRSRAVNVSVLSLQEKIAVVQGSMRNKNLVVISGQDRLQDNIEVQVQPSHPTKPSHTQKAIKKG